MKNKNTIFLLPLVLIAALLSGCATPLNTAAKSGDVEAARKLLDDGAKVNEWGGSDPNIPLRTPLHEAAENGQLEVVRLLLDRGAAINARATWLGTPLYEAAKHGHIKVVQLLLQKGADPRIATTRESEAGKTPRMIAEEKGYTEIARLLKDAETEGPRRVEATETDPVEDAQFLKAAQDYRNAATKPTLPEEARKFKVQAEVAVRDKQFEDAAELYGKALNIAPWWPEGHFNRAIVLGESRYYLGAIREMKRYLALVPDAPDARAAQDKIYEWERKAGK